MPKFWTRYKNYLIDEKHFSPNVVSTLGEDTLDQKLMNYILDPKEHYTTPVLKRGLIIGDVQSGKTSTYIGFLCKAADAGYKVFILLTGTTESLRKQTQERVEEGFIGIDMSAESKDGRRVGVGLDNQEIWAISMTSRVSDFVGDNDKTVISLHEIWSKYYSHIEFSWEEIAESMFQAIEKIQIKVVNSSKTSEKLEYPKDVSLRVIAIGGLALSRGLTLEGLIISYFYRNTSTYDVLMQMGRWFGYRKNYEDLFRIWTCKDSADWYAEIAEATDKLKDDMSLMRELGQKPRDFGIRVRNNSADLRITAYNKMRNSTDEYEFSSYYGGIVETPYLCYNAAAHINNYNEVVKLVNDSISAGISFERQTPSIGKGRYILQDVPKTRIGDEE